ncbi:MAG: hypothetical protein LBJ95_05250 [Oscillospiraceae bacterium]|nr:hypothetical protein [Oscillospiraceae bacterium]
MNKNVKTGEQLLNMNISGPIALSVEEVERVIGGAPVGDSPGFGHCDRCANNNTLLVYVTRQLPDQNWKDSGICFGCAVDMVKDYVKEHPEVLDQIVNGTINAAHFAAILGGIWLPVKIARQICATVAALMGFRFCAVA